MYTSDKKLYIRHIFILLFISVFTLIFSRIYDHFGHGITTPYMDFAFLIPIAGVIIYLILFLIKPKRNFSFIFRQGINLGLVTIMLGSICKGVFIIAGTDSPYVIIYPYTGCLLIICAATYYFLQNNFKKTYK